MAAGSTQLPGAVHGSRTASDGSVLLVRFWVGRVVPVLTSPRQALGDSHQSLPSMWSAQGRKAGRVALPQAVSAHYASGRAERAPGASASPCDDRSGARANVAAAHIAAKACARERRMPARPRFPVSPIRLASQMASPSSPCSCQLCTCSTFLLPQFVLDHLSRHLMLGLKGVPSEIWQACQSLW